MNLVCELNELCCDMSFDKCSWPYGTCRWTWVHELGVFVNNVQTKTVHKQDHWILCYLFSVVLLHSDRRQRYYLCYYKPCTLCMACCLIWRGITSYIHSFIYSSFIHADLFKCHNNSHMFTLTFLCMFTYTIICVGCVLLYLWNTWRFGLFSDWILISLCVGCTQQPPLFIIAVCFLLYGTQ